MKRSSKKSNAFFIILLAMCAMLFIGVAICIIMVPNHEQSGGPSVSSIFNRGIDYGESLSHKLLEWLPASHQIHLKSEGEVGTNNAQPDWNQEFWSPIDVDISLYDTTVTLCKLNFHQYSESPHMYPMFRDLETISKCKGSNKRREKLSVLMTELKEKEGTPEGRFIPPTGFVFHESRVGSTLIANTLASDPWSMVYSESAPAANALLHCSACSRKRNVEIFRSIVTLMGRSPFHKRLFFKFQSITSTKMDIALEAFPNTSWSFIYRNPVQTMMSHLDPAKHSTGAPCLRSMGNPPSEVSKAISSAGGGHSPPKEAWCAAHLNMLCSHAISAYNQYGTMTSSLSSAAEGRDGQRVRGLLINYESLPGIVPRLLLPLFGVLPDDNWLEKMKAEGSFYSKGRGQERKFGGDSADKENRATDAIEKWAELILAPRYAELQQHSEQAVQQIAPTELAAMRKQPDGPPNWAYLNPIPPSHEAVLFPLIAPYSDLSLEQRPLAATTAVNLSGHSAFPVLPYKPWLPFSNTHASVPFERAQCPDQPPRGYPVAYFITNLTENWNSDVTDIPDQHYDSLCHFNYQDPVEYQRALNYRKAEVPYVVYNAPEVDAVVRKWSDVDYLQKRLGNQYYRTETSKTNHFMYWSGADKSKSLRGGEKWTPPTGTVQEQFDKWLELAVKGQNKSLEDRVHHYFRISADNKHAQNGWIFDELPFFQPKPSLFMVQPNEQRGIHCRFGMRSVIAEAHFDGSRNSIAVLGGMRRYVLMHPDQCEYMHMLPRGHPSGRHSAIDYSQPDPVKFPNYLKLKGNEVILQPGDVLYLPTYWHHYIVSLNVNFQCNTRSGRSSNYDRNIRKCGF